MSARNGRHREARSLWGKDRCPCGGCDALRRAARRRYVAEWRARQRAAGVRFVHGYAVAPGEVPPSSAELRARRGRTLAAEARA